VADRYDPLGSGIKEATTGKRNCSNITTCFCIGVTWLLEAPAFWRIQRGPIGGQHLIEISRLESPSLSIGSMHLPPLVAKGGLATSIVGFIRTDSTVFLLLEADRECRHGVLGEDTAASTSAARPTAVPAGSPPA